MIDKKAEAQKHQLHQLPKQPSQEHIKTKQEHIKID